MTKPTEEIIEEPEVTTEEQVEEQVEEIVQPISELLQSQITDQVLRDMVEQFETLEVGLIDAGDPEQGSMSIAQFAGRARDDLATLAEGYYRWLESEFEEFKASVRRAKRAQNRITKELQSDMWSKEHKKNLEEEHARNVEILAATPAAFSDMKVILRALKTLRPS